MQKTLDNTKQKFYNNSTNLFFKIYESLYLFFSAVNSKNNFKNLGGDR